MEKQVKSPFTQVLIREVQRMTSRRLYVGVCLVLPLFCIFFMATIFGNGQMENLPIGIVDQDQTATSRGISRQVSAVPTFRITHYYANAEAARNATQAKEIYGYLVIPSRFEADIMANNSPTLSYYYHYALLSVGSEVLGAFESVLEPIALAPIILEASELGVTPAHVVSYIEPVSYNSQPLYNPNLDYSIYLSQPFFFILLQVIILLTTVYTVGSEIKFHTATVWLVTARMNIVTAVFAKLLPYTLIFSGMGILGNYVLFGLMHIPFSCGFWPLNLTMLLFVIATQALGIFLFSLFPVMSIVISVVSMVGSLGATISGVTFPAAAMFPVIYYLSYLFPVRHFVEINQNLLYGDFGFTYTWQNISALWGFVLVALWMLPQLKKAIIHHSYESIQ